MTPISITTYPEGEYTVIEFRWYDAKLRKPDGVRAGMDKADVLRLIKELQELVNAN